MRLPVSLLSVVAVPASVLAVPVASLPTPEARAVAPQVRELALPVTEQAAAGTVRAAGAARTLVATPEQRTEPFSTLGVTWAPDETTGEVQVQVRTRSRGAWTPWVALDAEELDGVLDGAPEEGAAGVRPGTEPLFAGPSDGVQVRVDVLSGDAPRDLRLALVDPGSSPADAAVPSTPASTAHAAAARPVIRSRAEWGADESIRKGSPSYASTLSAVTLHHTASSNDYTQADVPTLLRGFYAYHVKSQGWSDIGYNVLVDKFGTAWEGRAGGLDKPVIGAHSGGFNTNTTGVSMIGTYDTVEPSTAMKETVAQVSAWKLGLHDRDPLSTVTLTSGGSTRYAAGTQVTLPRIFGHRDVSTTACPGDRGMAAMPGLRQRAAALQGGTTTSPSAPAPEPAPEPPPPAKPFGAFDSARGAAGALQVTGWAIDPDAPAHSRIDVHVDGALATTLVADRRRPDVQAAYPQYSADHGFDGTVGAAPGRRRVCVTALDAPGTDHLALGCKDVDVASADPFGRLDLARATSDVMGVRLIGWALDGDATTSSGVTVLVDGSPVRTVVADLPRPDVASAYGGVRQESGYDVVVPALGGARQVCVRAANQGAGADVVLGCLAVDVPLRPAPAAAPGARTGALACPDGKVSTGGFTDIGTSVHRAAVECAVWWRLTAGLTADRYGPGLGVTRAQLATFLARTLTSAGRTLPAAPPDAFDDDRGSPHELAINQMAAVGVVAGRAPRRYDPAGPVTREQLASYLARAYEARVGGPLPDGGDWFGDDDTSVHQTSIGRVARAGFTGGTSPTAFSPGVPADRGQVAAFLVRVLDMMVEHGRARVPA